MTPTLRAAGPLSASIAFIAALLAVRPARAGCPDSYKAVTYFKKQQPLPPDSRCDVHDGVCKIELTGFLYRPAAQTPGPHPILIANHGSESKPSPECEVGEYFSKLGYRVFVPIRRGHMGSTGADFATYTSQYCTQPGNGGFCKMEYLKLQVEDIAAAIKFVKEQPGVDQSRIALIGHSFGAIATAFANERDLGQRAVVEVAPGSQSWQGNPDARFTLEQAVAQARTPMFLLEPLNDQSIDPTIRLAEVAGSHCRQYQSWLFPAIDVADPSGKITAKDYQPDSVRDVAHGKTMRLVQRWGPPVKEFLERNLAAQATLDDLCRGTSHQLTP